MTLNFKRLEMKGNKDSDDRGWRLKSDHDASDWRCTQTADRRVMKEEPLVKGRF